LINPRKRRRAAKKAKRRVRRSNPVSYRAVTRRARAANPAKRRTRRMRRRNPVAELRGRARRKSNPSLRGMFGGIVPMLKDAAVGAVGAIAVDAAMGQVNKYLPASMQPTPGALGTNDAIKMVTTVALGSLLSRATRGMSRKAAAGALTVQMDKAIRTFLPPAIKSQLAYGTVAPVVPGRMTVQPNAQRMNAYTAPGSATPLLNAYTRPGAASPLLNGRTFGNSRVGSAVR
jgi:hypothetical protein